MAELMLQGITLGLYAAVSPGPFQAFLLNQTIHQGWRRTLPAVLAPLISDGPIILLVVFILAQTPDWLLRGVQIGGGIFLLYLAYGAWQNYRRFTPADAVDAPAGEFSLLKAALINASGPGPYIFWSLLAGPIFLAGWKQSPPLGISFLIGFYGSLIGGFVVFVVLFATARRLGSQLNRILLGVSSLALLVFGLFQLVQGFIGST